MLVLCFVTTNIILDIRKRDELYMPLKKNENGHPGEKLLVEAVEIFKAWKSSGNIGLTSKLSLPASSDGLSFLWAWGSMIIRGLFFITFVERKTDHN